MKHHYLFKTAFAFLLCLSSLIKAQSGINGLLTNYCVNSPTSALSTTLTGGYFSGNGVIGTVFSPSLAGPGTHTITYGTCTGSYAITSGTGSIGGFTPVVNTTTTGPETPNQVSLGDDQTSGVCNIGFTFNFYCNSYTQFYISSNGFIMFNNGPQGCCTGQVLPSTTTPNDVIAPAWEDWNPGAGGSINYSTIGSAPTRTLLVNYINVPHFGSGGGPLTVQIKLMETTNIIEFHTTSMVTDGGGHTMGLEDVSGLAADVALGRNSSATWSAANELVRFTPIMGVQVTQTTVVSPSTINVVGTTSICAGQSTSLTASGNTTYTWSTGSNNAGVSVNPTSTTSYTVSGTNAFGCIANAVTTVTVFNGLPVLSVNSSTNSTCLGQTVALTASGAPNYTWSNGVPNGTAFTPTNTTTYVVIGGNSCGTSTAAVTVTVAPLPISVLASPSVICAGSTTSLTAVSTATTYTWMPVNLNTPGISVSPTISTIYTVSASDGICSGTNTLSILANPIPTINSTISSSVVCSGESVTLTATGGLSYVWSPVTSTGSMVVATVNGPTLFSVIGYNSFSCSATSNQVVITNPSPTINIAASDNLICTGSSVTLTASGASTYTWNTGSNSTIISDSPASTTIYTVTGSAANCSSSQTIQVGVFAPSVAISGQTAICTGATATLTASGADNYTWDNGSPVPVINVNPTSTTIYTVSATTASGNIVCPSSQTFQLLVNPNPTVSVVPTRTFMCLKETNTLTASGAGTYSWNTNATTPTIAITSSVATTLNFTVTGTSPQGCTNVKTIQVKVNGCTGIEETENGNGFVLYPNPNNGKFTIEINTDATLTLVNELGQLIRTFQLNSANHHKAEIDQLPPGIYFLQGQDVHAKVIVEK
jgi:hypothetical protein